MPRLNKKSVWGTATGLFVGLALFATMGSDLSAKLVNIFEYNQKERSFNSNELISPRDSLSSVNWPDGDKTDSLFSYVVGTYRICDIILNGKIGIIATVKASVDTDTVAPGYFYVQYGIKTGNKKDDQKWVSQYNDTLIDTSSTVNEGHPLVGDTVFYNVTPPNVPLNAIRLISQVADTSWIRVHSTKYFTPNLGAKMDVNITVMDTLK